MADAVARHPANGRSILVLLTALALPLGACSRSAAPTQAAQSPSASTANPAASGSSDAGRRTADPGSRAQNAGPRTPDSGALSPPPNLDLRQSPAVPLADGLTVVIAVVEERGDYEVVQRVSGPANDRIQVSYSTTELVNGKPTELRGQRVVLTKDLTSARIYRIRWLTGRSELARGTTALGVSSDVLEELRKNGKSGCSLASIEEAGALIGALGLPSPEYEGALQRVEDRAVPVPVVVDGERQWLPAIHAKGSFEGLTGNVDAEFWFLDNPQNPLTLRAVVGPARFVAVRIDRPKAVDSARLERSLESEEAVELPGVYFEFASAKLRSESDAAIGEVANVMRRHADWKLRIEGHTDNIGGAAPNLELSRARAEAVRAAIIQRLGGGGDRLEAAGFGLTRPRESNDSPEGRARNRRVEIVRHR